MKQVIILLVLSCSLLADKPVNLRMEKKAPTEFFNKIAKMSGKGLELKCKLPGEKYNWLYVNAPLRTVLEDACATCDLFFAFHGNKIVIDKVRVPYLDDKQYAIEVTRKFHSAFKNHKGTLQTFFGSLIKDLGPLKFNSEKLSFKSSPEAFRQFNKALKILGYADAKRELEIKFAIQRGADLNLKIYEFSIKGNGEKAAEIIGSSKPLRGSSPLILINISFPYYTSPACLFSGL